MEPPPTHDAPTTVAVLAGGLGTRMGGDKPSALFRGRPLISYPIAAAQQAGLPVIVVAKPSTHLPTLPATPVASFTALCEPEHPRHPLVGLITALEHFPRVVIVACDMPFVTAELLAALARGPLNLEGGVRKRCYPRVSDTNPSAERPAAFAAGGRVAPFPSLHTASELPSLRASLQREASLREAFRDAGVVLLPTDRLKRFGDPDTLLVSIDTPDALVDQV